MSRSRTVQVVAGLLAWVGAAGCGGPQPKVLAPKPPVVIVSQPVSDYVADYEDFTGRTDAIFSVEIRARVSGYLQHVAFKDGDEVKEGDLLFEIDPRPYQANLDRSEATLAQCQAHLDRLKADFRRVSNLYSRGQSSREEFDRASGDRSEAEAAVGVAQADYDLAKLNMKFTKITAPISGLLSRRLVDPGNLVQADTTALTTIVSLDPLYVYFDVDERTLLRLRRLVREKKIPSRQEQEVAVLGALSDEEGFPHKGLINFSDNRVDAATGTLRVRASIANPVPRVLSPGLFMRVRLPVGNPRKSIMIAEKALGTDQGQKYLYVVNDKNEVIKRLVKIGKLDAGMREIVDGLAPNQWVVVEGLQRIRPGLKVEPRTEESVKGPKEGEPASGEPKRVAEASSKAGRPSGAPGPAPAPAGDAPQKVVSRKDGHG
jgi:RND family efflux transporter MFP subunit